MARLFARLALDMRQRLALIPPSLVAALILGAGLTGTVAAAAYLGETSPWNWAWPHGTWPGLREGLPGSMMVYGILATGACLTGTLSAAYWILARRRAVPDLLQDVEFTLRHGRGRMHARADSAADAIVIVNEQRRVFWVNKRACAIFGQAREALIGLPVPQLLPVFMGQQMGSWLLRHGNGSRATNVDALGVHADGTAFPVSLSVASVNTSERQLYTCVVRAATNAKWAARELMLRERALASSTNGITIADMTQEGEPFIYVNPAFEDLTGYSAQEVLGRNARFLQRGDTAQEAIATLRHAISENRSCHVVLRNYRKDGTLFWNDLSIAPVHQADGQVTHYVGIQVDITERMQAEVALQLRTDRLNAVFALSPDGFVALDAQGTVTIVNPAFERMTGLRAAQLVGQTAEQFEEALASLCEEPPIPDEGPRRFIETQPPEIGEFDQAMPGLRAPMRLQQGLLHLRLPRERTLLRRSRRARDQGNETVMVFRDITRELEVDRMKSEFLSTAAHELRTPMSSIYGFAELLLRRPFTAEQQHDMLTTIHRQAGVLIELVNELLDLARIEARRGKDFNFQWSELQEVVHRTIEGLLVVNDERRVGLEMPREPIMVRIDGAKLSLALTNVLSNAYKYSPQGGRITLRVVSRRNEGMPEVGLSVHDHGIGMTPVQLARIFDRFYRADTSGNIPGTGLGMAIVKEIAELHGGSVMAQSRYGEGTVVTVWLPDPRNPDGQPWLSAPSDLGFEPSDHGDIEHLHLDLL